MGSFDRKVERNLVKLKKQGKSPIVKGPVGTNSNYTVGPRGEGDIFKGRKIILPAVLSLLAIMYGAVGLLNPAAEASSTLFWLTIGLYLLLAAVIFLRKPYLRIDKSKIYTSTFNRDKLLDASNINKIILSRSKIVIEPKGRQAKWVFYRTRNRFDTEAMALRLEQYGNTHHVTIEKK